MGRVCLLWGHTMAPLWGALTKPRPLGVAVYSTYNLRAVVFPSMLRRSNKLLYGLPYNSPDEISSGRKNRSLRPFSISITLQYAGYAENSINPGARRTYLFVRHTTLPVLAATLELSEFQYNTPYGRNP